MVDTQLQRLVSAPSSISLEELEDDNRRKQLVFLSRLLEKQLDDKLEFQEWFCQKDMFAKLVGEEKLRMKLLKDWFPAMVRRLSITLTDMTSNFCLCFW